MSDFIPPELVIDVLKRLSVDDLGQCLIVCKSWYSLITSPSFISLHTQNQSSPTNLLLVRSRTVRPQKENYSIQFGSNRFEEYKSFDFPSETRTDYLRVIGCFNGVVCVSTGHWNYTNTIILWNPYIRKSVTLPNPVWNGSCYHSVGFAFCAASSDFKVVRVSHLESDDGYVHRVPPDLEVYDLSKGCWRDVDPKGFPYIVHRRCPQAYLNGVVHWTGRNQYKEDSFRNMIVSFDMGTEELGVIEMPKSAAHDRRWGSEFCVSVLGESLSLIVSLKAGRICDIWKMEEYGKSESWTKMFTIGSRGGLEGAFGFLRNGEVLLQDNTNRSRGSELASYDPKSQQVKLFGIRGDANEFYVDNFVETLAMLGVKGDRAGYKED